MKKVNLIFATLIVFMFTLNVQSQGSPSYSKIVKNVNPTAKGLFHDLNASKDSIVYRHNDQEVLRVSFLSHKSKGNKKLDFGKRSVRVSLDSFGIGRYTVAVYLSGGEIIVHGLVRLLPIPTKKLEKDSEDLRVAILKTPKKLEVIKKFAKTAPVAKEKKKVVVAAVTENKKKTTKIITNPSKKKKSVAAVKPKRKAPPIPKGPTLADKLKQRAKRDALAAIEAKKEQIRQRQFDDEIRANAPEDLEVIKVSYNLSRANSKTNKKETRAEYRKKNLRPNGKPYDD